MGPFQISDTPFQGNVILNIDFWRRLWTRFGPTRVRAPQKVSWYPWSGPQRRESAEAEAKSL